jgi:squalene/oxidosqualene cyclase-like protein
MPNESAKPKTAGEAAEKAMQFYQMLQCEDGHWAGDYGGPMFLMPGLIITFYITKAEYPKGRREGMIEYLKNHQQEDGGWGTHIECASTMFGTVLSYVALRLLGESPSSEYMKAAHGYMMAHGGALFAPSWAKFWLAALGVYEWDGINSIPPEMWFLPRWFPLHPGKMWCHCRMVYLPMCYLYGKRFQPPNVDKDPLLQALRSELYLPEENYDTIEWDAFRQTCAPDDDYSGLNPVMALAQDILSVYEAVMKRVPLIQKLRNAGVQYAIKYIHAEDAQTNYVDIGPVNKALNMLSVWVDAGGDMAASRCEAFQRHLCRVDDYIWVAEDGVKMQGYNGYVCKLKKHI